MARPKKSDANATAAKVADKGVENATAAVSGDVDVPPNIQAAMGVARFFASL